MIAPDAIISRALLLAALCHAYAAYAPLHAALCYAALLPLMLLRCCLYARHADDMAA